MDGPAPAGQSRRTPIRAATTIGRDEELHILTHALATARGGNGRVVFLIGEGGIGKSRLAATAEQAASATGMRLLHGRGSAIGPTIPFRPLTEALLSLRRGGEPVDVDWLGPYRPVLGRLVPEWGPPLSGQGGPELIILAEAVRRLLELTGRSRGCLLTLEDLHNADSETLAVLDYLVDNLDHQPTLLLGTLRADPCPALDLARTAAQRGGCLVIELNRLSEPDLRRMAGSCLGVSPESLPEPAVDLLWAGSAGNPLLIEELLGDMVDGGLLVPDDAGWRVTPPLRTAAPATLVSSMAHRLDHLDRQTRELVLLAAVLGPRFPLPLLRRLAGRQDQELVDDLRIGPVAALIGPDSGTPDWYAFRHPLLMEALLALLHPPRRRTLARQAAEAVEAAYPGLPGEWCSTAAALWLDAGDRTAAGRLFVDAGRRALVQGAADSAVALLDRAHDLLADDDPVARADLVEALIGALSEAGQVDRTLALVGLLDELGGGLDHQRRARLHTRVAWAAAVTGRPTDGLRQVEVARALLGPDASPEDLAPVDVVTAHLLLDAPGQGQLTTAEAMARRAAGIAETVPLPVVACQAWQLLGALRRPRDPDEATRCLERARDLAVRHDLPIWEIHALVRLGNDDALRDGNLTRLEYARQAATRAGAVVARYQAEASLTLQFILCGEYLRAEALASAVLASTTRLRLMETTQYVLLLRAVLAAHQGQRRNMNHSLSEFHHWGGDQAQHAPRVYGLARLFCALLEEDLPLALDESSRAARAERDNPTIFHLAGQYGMHLLLGALTGETDWSTYQSVTSTSASRLRWDRQFALFAQAVLAGRAGHAGQATDSVNEALRAGAPFAMGRHLGLRLVCEAALAGGWGTPVEWLRAAEEYFHSSGVPAVAVACRKLLRRAGVRPPQRRTGVAEIPAPLRAAGVTSREYEVLGMLVDRLSNREIADRLHLSPRTVEKHVASLLVKTRHPDRVTLGRFASRLVTTAHPEPTGQRPVR